MLEKVIRAAHGAHAFNSLRVLIGFGQLNGHLQMRQNISPV